MLLSSIIHKIKRLLRSPFLRNVAVLTSGTVIAQAIPFLLSPVLTRLYSPIDYGINAIYLATITIVILFASMRYNVAIVVADNDRDAAGLAWICIFFTAFVSLFMLVIALLFGEQISHKLGIEQHGWVYMVPVTIMMYGIYDVLVYYNIRLKNFALISKATVLKVFLQVIVQIGMGAAGFGYMGLVIGNVVSYLAGNAGLVKKMLESGISFEDARWNNITRVASTYIKFPKFSMPAELASSLANNLIPFFMSMIYSPRESGYFALAYKTVGMPISIIGNSVRQVFLKKAADEHRDSGSLFHIFKKTTALLALIAVPFAVIVFIFGEALFSIAFGSEWSEAGQYTKALILLFLARFIIAPVLGSVQAIGFQRIGMIMQLLLLCCAIVPSLLAHYIHMEAIIYLFILSTAMGTAYFIFYVVIMKLTKSNKFSNNSSDIGKENPI